jgi:hypothetical protein
MSDTDKAARERAERKHPNNHILRDWCYEDFKAGASHERSRPLSEEEAEAMVQALWDHIKPGSPAESKAAMREIYSALQRMRSKG